MVQAAGTLVDDAVAGAPAVPVVGASRCAARGAATTVLSPLPAPPAPAAPAAQATPAPRPAPARPAPAALVPASDDGPSLLELLLVGDGPTVPSVLDVDALPDGPPAPAARPRLERLATPDDDTADRRERQRVLTAAAACAAGGLAFVAAALWMLPV